MMKLLDMGLTFLYRTSHKNEDDKCPIILRISFAGDFTNLGFVTPLFCVRNKGKTQKVFQAD